MEVGAVPAVGLLDLSFSSSLQGEASPVANCNTLNVQSPFWETPEFAQLACHESNVEELLIA